ncbi:MAG: DUF1801 domain-containing protein [Thermodesulfobacteriota bacterium]
MTIDEYMAKVPAKRRGRMEEILGSIRSWFPGARISMKYNMPTFEVGDRWVAVANQKSYVSLYTCSEEHIAPYAEKHPAVRSGKGCLNFRDREVIYFKDLREVVSRAFNAEK